MTRSIFVAGGTGVLGRRALPLLVQAGFEVTAGVRRAEARAQVAATGAEPVMVDLFDATDVERAVGDADVVVNLATSIPSVSRSSLRRAWKANDLLRTHGARHLARASNGHYIGESITFPYAASGDRWIDEATERDFFWANESVKDAEAAATAVTKSGGTGVTLRFAMFSAADSHHTQAIVGLARRGLAALPGSPEAYVSWIDADDAASAVVAALDAPAGAYNVAEAAPVPRRVHIERLAEAVGRRLRPLPSIVQRLGGAGIASMARSQRISSAAFTDATGWVARRPIADEWSTIVGSNAVSEAESSVGR